MQSTIAFPDPAALSEIGVADLLRLAASGHVGIDKRWMQAILDRGEAAVPELVAFASEDREDDPVNLEEDLVAIFAHYRSAESVPFLIGIIRKQPDEVEDDIIEALIRIGQPAVDPLLTLYDEIGEEEGSDVGFVLASIGVRDERILHILLDRLEYDAADGAFLLGLYSDPAAKSALEKMLAEIDPEQDAELRRELVYAIEGLDAEKQPEEPEPEADILAPYPDKAVPPVEVLTIDERLEMLSCPSPEYRTEAAESFRGTGELPDKVKNRLLDIAQNDDDRAVRGAAWRSLVDAMDDKAVVGAMLKTAADESLSDDERLGALISLVQGDDSDQLATLIRSFYDKPATRARAMEAMWRSLDPAFSTIYSKHLDDSDIEIRRNAIWGVGYSGLSAEVGRLRAFFDDEDLRADALFAYAMAMPGGVSRGRVRGMLRKIDDLANGLTAGEVQLVKMALDQRLAMNGQEPVFAAEEEEAEASGWEEVPDPVAPSEGIPAPAPQAAKVGRNDPCPCGSGKKHKKCCGANS